jgi:SAM-dependent methyltransferase
MGAFSSRRPAGLMHIFLPTALLLALMALPITQSALAGISERLAVIGDPMIWHARQRETGFALWWDVGVGLTLSLGLMVLVWAAFVPLGRILGRLLDDHPRPIRAYSINVAGSLVGTWLLVVLSLGSLAPVWWWACIALLAIPFLDGGRARWIEIALVGGCVGLSAAAGIGSGSLETLWSPYQKLELSPAQRDEPGKWAIRVNNVGYQSIIDLSPQLLRSQPRRYPPNLLGLSQYDIPMRMHPEAHNVLLVGAGSGNDAAGALRNGADRVTAVEIDPVIIELGRRYHPEKPYDDPRVEVVIDDARSFFSNTQETYDLIVFGLLDSHTTTSMTNARLDHYVYTLESLQQVRSLLSPNGVVVMTFAAEQRFIGERIARTLTEVFGEKPFIVGVPGTAYGWGGLMFVAGDLDGVRHRLGQDARLGSAISGWQQQFPINFELNTPIATDDWPYLYLPEPRLPILYVLLAGMMAVLFAIGVRLADCREMVRGWGRRDSHFFFLGAAFLLLEVQNISKASLVLGNTWWVNSVIISGVLTMVLLANAVADRFPKLPLVPVYACLLASCAGLYFFDLTLLSALPFKTRALAVGGLTTLPMFFSGIIFVRSFAGSNRRDEALGANLVGALIGGLLQSVTFLVGIKALLLLVALLYLGAFFTRPALSAPAEGAPS